MHFFSKKMLVLNFQIFVSDTILNLTIILTGSDSFLIILSWGIMYLRLTNDAFGLRLLWSLRVHCHGSMLDLAIAGHILMIWCFPLRLSLNSSWWSLYLLHSCSALCQLVEVVIVCQGSNFLFLLISRILALHYVRELRWIRSVGTCLMHLKIGGRFLQFWCII